MAYTDKDERYILQQAAAIRKLSQEYRTLIANAAESTMKQMSQWTGEAADAQRQKIREVLSKANETVAELLSISVVMENYAATHKTTKEKIMDFFGG